MVRRVGRFASFALLLALAVLAVPRRIPAQPATAAVSARVDSAAASLARTAATPADSARAFGPPWSPPPRDYLAEARRAFTPENRAYSGLRVVVRLVEPLYGILCGLLLMFTGLSTRFREIAEGLGHRRYVRVLVYFTLYSTTLFVLGLPLAWYQEFALEHQFGLSTESLGGWLLDALKSHVMTLAVLGVVPLLALAWMAVEKHPRTWWLWIAAFTMPVAAASILLQPLVFDPMFNKFEPLHDDALRTRILALGEKAGIPSSQVFQVDMSRRTRKLNAYVTGFGASHRVVLWDTTLQTMQTDEILFVTGHEMGHYVLKHVWKAILLMSVSSFALLWLTSLLAGAWLRAFGTAWNVRGVGDLAAMPVLFLSLTLVTLVATPGFNAIGRAEEHDADVFGLEITRDNDAAARSFLKLGQGNRSDPDPPAWVRVLLYDHPPLADRIRFALAYRPWEHGEPNRFYRPR